MALETTSYINGLNPSNPPGSDRVHQGDDHIRLLKSVLKNTFPHITGPVNLTQDQLNGVFNGSVVTGMILLWYGSDTNVPGGWAICNGSTYAKSDGSGPIASPDLRGRVAIGPLSPTYVQGTAYGSAKVSIASNPGGGGSVTGSTGSAGAHDHGSKTGGTALSVSQIPSHKHGNGIADGQDNEIYTHGAFGGITTSHGVSGSDDTGRYEGYTSSDGGGQSHDHTISSAGGHTHEISYTVPDHSHNIVDIPVLQPSLALHYIMKL